MNREELKNLQNNCKKLTDDQIPHVLANCFEGLQAFKVLEEKGIRLFALESSRQKFDTTAIRALYVAQEYAKRNGKDFKNVNEMISQITPHDVGNPYRSEYLSIESSMEDVLETVYEVTLTANNNHGIHNCLTHMSGQIVISPRSAENAEYILRDPVAAKEKEIKHMNELRDQIMKIRGGR